MSDPRLSKKVITGSIAISAIFRDFESLVVIDDNSDMTFTDEDGNTCTWPSGVPFSIGGSAPKLSSYVKVSATTGNYGYYGGTILVSSLEQYVVYSDATVVLSATVTYQDGSVYVRKLIRDSKYCVDITLTSTGFAGTEGVDWVNILEYTGTLAVYRSGSRDGYFTVDATLTATGFAGVEDTDWEWLNRRKDPSSSETTFRDGARGGAYVIDQTLTATGFAGIENTDWVNLIEFKAI